MLSKKDKARDTYLVKFYGITLAAYNKILKAQNFACAICHRPASKFKRSLAVDHSHSSGRVRGLLCPFCNRGLRYFRDDEGSFTRAAEHLKRDYGTVPAEYLKGRKRRRTRRKKRK